MTYEPQPSYSTRIARAIYNLTSEYVQRLRKDDWVRVYHGTSLRFGARHMVFGIDALEMKRNFEHPTRRDVFRPRGLFVAPSLQESLKFGSVVFEFAARVRNLHPTDFNANILRHWERGEGGEHGGKNLQGPVLQDLKKRCATEYPNSDRPLLSAALDPMYSTFSPHQFKLPPHKQNLGYDEQGRKDWNCGYDFRSHEPQALFVGIVPAKDILAIHYKEKSYNPKEFVEEFLADKVQYEPHPQLDPKSTRLSWEDYEELILPHFGSMEDLARKILDKMEKQSYRKDEVQGLPAPVYFAIQELLRILPFSRASAKKLLGMLMERYPRQKVATTRSLLYSSDQLFLAASKRLPPGWCYDHVGFVDKRTGQLIQMSGHRQDEGVFPLSRLTEDEAIETDDYDVVDLPRTVEVPTDTLGAENCVTFVVAVLEANGIHDWDIEDFHDTFKCGEKIRTASAPPLWVYEEAQKFVEQELKNPNESTLISGLLEYPDSDFATELEAHVGQPLPRLEEDQHYSQLLPQILSYLKRHKREFWMAYVNHWMEIESGVGFDEEWEPEAEEKDGWPEGATPVYHVTSRDSADKIFQDGFRKPEKGEFEGQGPRAHRRISVSTNPAAAYRILEGVELINSVDTFDQVRDYFTEAGYVDYMTERGHGGFIEDEINRVKDRFGDTPYAAKRAFYSLHAEAHGSGTIPHEDFLWFDLVGKLIGKEVVAILAAYVGDPQNFVRTHAPGAPSMDYRWFSPTSIEAEFVVKDPSLLKPIEILDPLELSYMAEGYHHDYEGYQEEKKIQEDTQINKWYDEYKRVYGSTEPSPEERTRIFDELAQQQRGAPEQAMNDYQRQTGSGLYGWMLEHVGDLINRMSQKVIARYGGYGYVDEKVHKTLRELRSVPRFSQNVREQLRSNAEYNGVDLDEFKRLHNKLRRVYTEEHKKLPTYNHVQRLAKTAAVSMGQGDFYRAKDALSELAKYLVSEEVWIQAAHDWDPDGTKPKVDPILLVATKALKPIPALFAQAMLHAQRADALTNGLEDAGWQDSIVEMLERVQEKLEPTLKILSVTVPNLVLDDASPTSLEPVSQGLDADTRWEAHYDEASHIYKLIEQVHKRLSQVEEATGSEILNPIWDETRSMLSHATIRAEKVLENLKLDYGASIKTRVANTDDFITEFEVGRLRWPGVRVEVTLDDYSDDIAEVANVHVRDPEARRQGIGSEVLAWLTGLADKHGVTLKLHVEPFGKKPLPKSAIKRFYQEHGFTNRKMNWMVRKPIRREASMNDYLYHVSLLRNIPSIANSGLVVGRSQNWPGYSSHARGRVFLTEEEAVNEWIHKVTYSAAMDTDYPVEEGFIPVVLRVPSRQVEDHVHEDELGSQDVLSGASYYVEDVIDPDELEVYTPNGWVPVRDIDTQDMLDYALENSPRDSDDGEEWVELDEYIFAPDPGPHRRHGWGETVNVMMVHTCGRNNIEPECKGEEGFSVLPTGKMPKTKKEKAKKKGASSSFKKPTPAMITFFEKRTREHIGRVVKFMKMMQGFEGIDDQELVQRAREHDKDKYSDKDLVLPYIWITEYHRVNNDKGSVPDWLQEQYDLAEDASGTHVERNLHHPEAHESIDDMTNLDLAEMVCDWAAMAEELDEGSPRGWADKNVGDKWKFSDDQEKYIYSVIDHLEEKGNF